jgi:hypothetical protein
MPYFHMYEGHAQQFALASQALSFPEPLFHIDFDACATNLQQFLIRINAEASSYHQTQLEELLKLQKARGIFPDSHSRRAIPLTFVCDGTRRTEKGHTYRTGVGMRAGAAPIPGDLCRPTGGAARQSPATGRRIEGRHVAATSA